MPGWHNEQFRNRALVPLGQSCSIGNEIRHAGQQESGCFLPPFAANISMRRRSSRGAKAVQNDRKESSFCKQIPPLSPETVRKQEDVLERPVSTPVMAAVFTAERLRLI